VKLLGAYFLIGLPGIHIYGAPISTFLCDTVIVGINFSMIAKHTDVLPSLRRALGKPLIIAFLAVTIPGGLYTALVLGGYSHVSLFFAAVPVTMAIYFILCLRMGLVGDEELSMLPRGISHRLARVCKVGDKPKE
jgi:stage V sporulation protein B